MTGPADKRGFALPLVLGMVVVLSLVLIAGLSALSSLRDETKSAVASVDFERTAATAEARLQYLMLTEPLGSKGLRIGGTRVAGGGGSNADATIASDALTLLIADDRPYRWRADTDTALDYRAAVQDEAGLLNVFQADSYQVSRLLQQAGLSADSGDRLASELLEYNAEPTPHEPIKRLAELMSLPSAHDLVSERVFNRVRLLAAVHSDSTAVNINTAPREVLKAWFDLSDSQLDQALKDRDDAVGGLSSPSSIGAQAPGLASNYIFPGGRMRFTFSDPRIGLTYTSTLVLTPNDQKRPIWVENASSSRQRPTSESDDDLEDFPQIDAGAP